MYRDSRLSPGVQMIILGLSLFLPLVLHFLGFISLSSRLSHCGGKDDHQLLQDSVLLLIYPSERVPPSSQPLQRSQTTLLLAQLRSHTYPHTTLCGSGWNSGMGQQTWVSCPQQELELDHRHPDHMGCMREMGSQRNPKHTTQGKTEDELGGPK